MQPATIAQLVHEHVSLKKSRLVIASFPGLQSPNVVESLVKLLRRMTSGRRWVYRRGRWVDVGRRGTSGEVQSVAR